MKKELTVKEKSVTFRLPVKEHNIYMRQARKAKKTLSEYIRDILSRVI
jgi:hypothetical protein